MRAVRTREHENRELDKIAEEHHVSVSERKNIADVNRMLVNLSACLWTYRAFCKEQFNSFFGSTNIQKFVAPIHCFLLIIPRTCNIIPAGGPK